MPSDIIREYLVKLGVDISASQIKKMEDGLNKIDKQIVKFFKFWTNSTLMFSRSYAKIANSILGFGTRISKADMGMQRWAKTMYLTTDSAKALDRTLSAMDLELDDLRDIALNPELTKQYKELINLSHSLTVGPDFENAAKGFREIAFEFQKLKVVGEYFKEKIVAYIWKVLQSTPAKNFISELKKFNSSVIKTMDKIAKVLGTIAGYFLSAAYQFTRVINPVISFLDSLPDKVKLVGSTIAAIVGLLMAGPFGKFLLIFQAIGMLIEDYQVYMQGGKSATILKPVWDFVNELPEKIEVIKNYIKDIFDTIKIEIDNLLKIPFIAKIFGEVENDNDLKEIMENSYEPKITTPYLTREQERVHGLGLDEAARESMEREEAERNTNITINVNGARDPQIVASETVAMVRRFTGVYA